MKEGIESTVVADRVRLVLEGLPFQQSFHRLDARRYLAKLDFNMVQSLYQKELQELSRYEEIEKKKNNHTLLKEMMICKKSAPNPD